MSAGEPFARLAASGEPSRLRVTAAVLLLVPVTAVASVLVVAVAGPGELTDPAFLLVATLVVPLVWLGIAAAVARCVLRIRPATALSVTGRFRVRWYARCLAVAVPVGGTLAALPLLTAGGTPSPTPSWPVALAVVVLCVPLQAFAEEYLFRGVLMLAIGARFARRGAAVAVPLVTTSVLFALFHPHPDPALLALAAFGGALYALLTHLTGGLEASSAAHAVWNVGPLVAAGVLGLDASTVTPGGVVMAALGEAALAGLLVLLARRDGVASRTAETVTAGPVRGPGPRARSAARVPNQDTTVRG